MKSYVVHLKNKYPGAQVTESESSIDVFQDGEHKISLKKNGAGQWVDKSEDYGCSDKFCLAPIPKDSRVHKLHSDGKIGKSEEHAERAVAAKQFVDESGKVLSCKELEAKGWEFCSQQKVVKSPSK